MFLSAVVLQVGDVLTQVESVDQQWIMGVVGEKRGIVPKKLHFPSLSSQPTGSRLCEQVGEHLSHLPTPAPAFFPPNFPGVCFNVHTAAGSALIGC